MKQYKGNVTLPAPSDHQWLCHDHDNRHYLYEDHELDGPEDFLQRCISDYRGDGAPVISDIRGREVWVTIDEQ